MTRPPVDGWSDLVGDTPLIRLRRLVDDGPTVYAKLEAANPGGSAKDRPARAMVEAALAEGRLRPGDTIVESSSGNLGVALARLASWHGLGFTCVVDPRANRQTTALIEAYGGRLHVVESPDPETGDWLAARQQAVADLVAADPRAWNPDQYSSQDNALAHADGTMREIVEALDGRLDALFVATSTTGTLLGCERHLRAAGLDTTLYAVDAEGSVLFDGQRGTRRLPGFGAGVVPALSREVHPDHVVRVDDLACVVGCRRLVRHEALLAGASGGGVVSAFLSRLDDFGPDDTVVLVLHDGGERYLDTVYDDQWVADQLCCPPERLGALVDEPIRVA